MKSPIKLKSPLKTKSLKSALEFVGKALPSSPFQSSHEKDDDSSFLGKDRTIVCSRDSDRQTIVNGLTQAKNDNTIADITIEDLVTTSTHSRVLPLVKALAASSGRKWESFDSLMR